jgi:hypothetical protein
VRRLVPWALVLLIGIGAGAGAALGAAHSSGTTSSTSAAPAQWVAGVLATTAAGGTAHLDYEEVTTSVNPVLRGTAAGGGVVDFAAGTFRVSQVDHQSDWTVGPGGQIEPHPETFVQASIAVGPVVYLNLGPTGRVGWSKESIPRDRSGLGLGSANGFSSALTFLSAPFTVRSVRDLGAGHVGAETTTRYLVRSQLQQDCTNGKRDPAALVEGRDTTVWVDGHGRLVQVQNALYSSGRLPASIVKANPILAVRPKGSMTQHNTLRFSAFGAPVHIAPPTALVGGGIGTSEAVLQTCAS